MNSFWHTFSNMYVPQKEIQSVALKVLPKQNFLVIIFYLFVTQFSELLVYLNKYICKSNCLLFPFRQSTDNCIQSIFWWPMLSNEKTENRQISWLLIRWGDKNAVCCRHCWCSSSETISESSKRLQFIFVMQEWWWSRVRTLLSESI